MLRKIVPAPGLALTLCACALADVTVRQSMSMKLPSFVPAELQKQWLQQAQDGAPAGSVLRIKGDKAYASFGRLKAITDYGRNEVTLLDSKMKRYATVPLSEFGDRFAAVLKATASSAGTQPLPQNLQFDIQTKKTGQVGMIQGVQAEESLTEVTMQLPLMTQMPAGPAVAAPSTVRLEVRSWVAQAAEIRRVPALKELADYAERSKRAFDTSDFAQKALAAMPVLGEQLGRTLQELAKTTIGLTLKTSTSIYLPAIAQLLQLAPGGAPADFDPNGPIAETIMDVADISTDSLPDSEFAVPPDYKAAPFEELARTALQTPVELPSAAIPGR